MTDDSRGTEGKQVAAAMAAAWEHFKTPTDLRAGMEGFGKAVTLLEEQRALGKTITQQILNVRGAIGLARLNFAHDAKLVEEADVLVARIDLLDAANTH